MTLRQRNEWMSPWFCRIYGHAWWPLNRDVRFRECDPGIRRCQNCGRRK